MINVESRSEQAWPLAPLSEPRAQKLRVTSAQHAPGQGVRVNITVGVRVRVRVRIRGRIRGRGWGRIRVRVRVRRWG